MIGGGTRSIESKTKRLMPRPMVIFDVDGTLTNAPPIWQVLLERAGVWQGAGERNLARFLAGEIDYPTFCDLDAALLTGQRYDDLRRIAAGLPVYAGLDAVFAYFAAREYVIGLLSAGLKLLTDRFTARYDIDFCLINDLAQQDGVCTGESIVAVGWHDKGAIAAGLIARYRPGHVVAFGDSGGDVPVFRQADFSVAVNTTSADLLALASYHVQGDDLSVCLPHLPDWL